MRTTSDNSINSNMALAMALWPNAQWTGELQSLWRERLGGLNQDIVADAIKLVKPAFSSHQPELKWILTKASELHEQRYPRFLSGGQRQVFWHASWQQPSRHGNWMVWYGKWCSSEEEAWASIPKGCAGKVSSSEPADDTIGLGELREEEDEARQWLAATDRESIVALIERLRKVGFCTRKLPGRIGEWTRMEAMTVYAAHLMQEGGSK